MNTLSAINSLATKNPKELISMSENKYYGDINNLAKEIAKRKDLKIILIAGPSGSGKTTTSHILKDALNSYGIISEVISLDHFYLPLDKMPKDETGRYDFETVYSLDIPKIHNCFAQLLTNGCTDIPVFDFNKGGREEKFHHINIKNNGIAIVEGLHALNPVLTDKLSGGLFKIYISVNSSVLSDDGTQLLSSRQIRLARRISRDFLYRNTSAENTLKLWTSVVAGEEKYLYCFKDRADVKLVTFHSFEPCVFKDIIIKLLDGLTSDVENYQYAIRTKNALEKFVSLDYNLVPETSLIREFVRGGVYEKSK